MSDLKTRTKWRKKNREKAEYYKQYYVGEAGDKNRDRAARNSIMEAEAGVLKKYLEKQKIKKQKT